jgi:glyoxylase-like metal-dependent hydrolase (beta-lactamase superfamily II)
MQEIAPHVFIETAYAGVALGAISWNHGLVLIDAPFRPDDVRSWRAALLNLGSGVDRLLINLDAQLDRTLGARAMECTIVGHEKMAQVFHNRPLTFKSQSPETGAEWELYENIGNTRWAPPEITFTENLQLHWDDQPLLVEHHPGPAAGALWAILPEQAVIFLGDAVVMNQPPFLASADLPAWQESLQLLLSSRFRNFTLVSGRGGLVPAEQVHAQIRYLTRVQTALQTLADRNAPPEETKSLVSDLMRGLKTTPERDTYYRQRLTWGLYQYYIRHYGHVIGEVSD